MKFRATVSGDDMYKIIPADGMVDGMYWGIPMSSPEGVVYAPGDWYSIQGKLSRHKNGIVIYEEKDIFTRLQDGDTIWRIEYFNRDRVEYIQSAHAQAVRLVELIPYKAWYKPTLQFIDELTNMSNHYPVSNPKPEWLFFQTRHAAQEHVRAHKMESKILEPFEGIAFQKIGRNDKVAIHRAYGIIDNRSYAPGALSFSRFAKRNLMSDFKNTVRNMVAMYILKETLPAETIDFINSCFNVYRAGYHLYGEYDGKLVVYREDG